MAVYDRQITWYMVKMTVTQQLIIKDELSGKCWIVYRRHVSEDKNTFKIFTNTTMPKFLKSSHI